MRREKHSATVINNFMMYIFGGFGSTGPNDTDVSINILKHIFFIHFNEELLLYHYRYLISLLGNFLQ